MFCFESPIRGVQNRYWVNTICFVYKVLKITKSEKEKQKNQKKIFSDSEKNLLIEKFFFFQMKEKISNLSKTIFKSSFSKMLFLVLGLPPNKMNNVMLWQYIFYACQMMIFKKNQRVLQHTLCLLF